jgi:hypothetical protein
VFEKAVTLEHVLILMHKDILSSSSQVFLNDDILRRPVWFSSLRDI